MKKCPKMFCTVKNISKEDFRLNFLQCNNVQTLIFIFHSVHCMYRIFCTNKIIYLTSFTCTCIPAKMITLSSYPRSFYDRNGPQILCSHHFVIFIGESKNFQYFFYYYWIQNIDINYFSLIIFVTKPFLRHSTFV
jgi:hypothetical protein